MRIHSRLRHENIIQLYAAFEDDTHVYLVQEYAEGAASYFCDAGKTETVTQLSWGVKRLCGCLYEKILVNIELHVEALGHPAFWT